MPQDEAGTLLLVQLLFRGQLPPAALGLHPGHMAVIGGVRLGRLCASAEGTGRSEIPGGRQGGVEPIPDAIWEEVCVRVHTSVHACVCEGPEIGL